MHMVDGICKRLRLWARKNDNVRAMILTGSRAERKGETDALSDYDVQLFVRDTKAFMDDTWLKYFGDIMIRWPLMPMPTWNENWITRLVHFRSGVRIDFQITSVTLFNADEYDSGFLALVDKDGMAKTIPKPTSKKYLIRKPTEEEFAICVNEFFWDATYVPKELWRGNLCRAKYMLDSVIRFHYFQQMIEWHVGMEHDWSIGTGENGRDFKKNLDPQTWTQLGSTFAGKDLEENWQAFFGMVDLFRRLAREVAKKLKYRYPEKTDEDLTKYYEGIRMMKKDNGDPPKR